MSGEWVNRETGEGRREKANEQNERSTINYQLIANLEPANL